MSPIGPFKFNLKKNFSRGINTQKKYYEKKMQQDLNEAFLFGSKSGNEFLKELEDSSEKKKRIRKKRKKRG